MSNETAYLLPVLRWLEESTNITNDTTLNLVTNDGEVLRDTFIVYGSIFVVATLLFCWVRLKFPRPYTVRQWTNKPELKTYLADDQYGFFSWMWILDNTITEDEISDECGMDALCFLRTLSMGYKICWVGMINAIWLMPLYATAPDTPEVTDPVTRITVANVAPESNRLIGTVLAAYIMFGCTMWLILIEFEWFIEMRHKFLRKAEPRNYTVYVRNIPPEYRSNAGLELFFRECYSDQAVLQANLKVTTPQLVKQFQKRTTCIAKLEHALAYQDLKGVAPTHRDKLVGGHQVDSIDTYANELKELNVDITGRIQDIEQKMALADGVQITRPTSDEDASVSLLTATDDVDFQQYPRNNAAEEHSGNSNIVSGGFKSITSGAKSVTSSAGKLANSAVALVAGGEDGEYYTGGFVSFTSLSTTNAARQMVHHATPFDFEVRQAPDPDDIFWGNVGREHKDLQLGNLFSRVATLAFCVFWTIPMAFIGSISSVESLKLQYDWVADAIYAFPVLEPILQLLAPLMVLVVNALLPVILNAFSMLEGPVSGSVVVASTFTKLALFMVIQTFFVTAISGGIMDEIRGLVKEPLKAIDLLANSLPGQSTFFIQLAFIGTVLFVAIENLRVVALIQALVRRCIGPKLTEKERQTTFLGIHPLADPVEFEHDSNMSQISVLYFMIVFVYQTIAPLTNFVLAFCFLILRPFCLHQFVFIYPSQPDSGGKIWSNFINVILGCMIVAELTIVGLMGLKKSVIASTLMIPLIIITILFLCYIHQEHFRVAQFLPSKECLKVDLQHDVDLETIKDQYVQEELLEKQAFPDDLSDERAVALGLKQPVDEELAATSQQAADPLVIEPVVGVEDTEEEPPKPDDGGYRSAIRNLFLPINI